MIRDSLLTPNPLTHHPDLGAGQQHLSLHLAHTRMTILSLCFGLLFGALGLRMVDLSVLGLEEWELKPEVTLETYMPTRAPIYDRHHRLIATTIPAASASLRPHKLLNKPDVIIKKISKILPTFDAKDAVERIKEGKKFIWLSRKLSPSQQDKLLLLGEPGIGFHESEHRIYPYGSLFAHVLGQTNIDNKGISGLEYGLDEKIQSQEEIVTSLDLSCQEVITKVLMRAIKKFKAKAANALVIKLDTGEVISSVSLPAFAPGQKASEEGRFNRNTLGSYEMGSILKAINVVMALESGKAHLDTLYDTTKPIAIGRFRIKDFHPVDHWLSLDQIFLKSSNIGSIRILQSVGIEAQRAFFRHIGLLDRITTELPEVGSPHYPVKWQEPSCYTITYGYGISFTPLHFASTIAALMRGGEALKPTFLKRSSPQHGPHLIKPETSSILRNLMHRVVQEGTARKAKVPGYIISGKTGTANVLKDGRYVDGKVVTSFIGTIGSQLDKPEYLLLAMLDEPQPLQETFGFNAAGWNAAPVAGEIFKGIAPLLGIEPTPQAAGQNKSPLLKIIPTTFFKTESKG